MKPEKDFSRKAAKDAKFGANMFLFVVVTPQTKNEVLCASAVRRF